MKSQLRKVKEGWVPKLVTCRVPYSSLFFADILKGTVSRDFLLPVFFLNQFPQASDYTIRAVSNFFRKFAEIFVAQGLPPVSTTPVANGKNLQAEKF
jgi:hypothetical protein